MKKKSIFLNCRGQSVTEYILLSFVLIIAAMGVNKLFARSIAKYFNHVASLRTGGVGMLP
ncbi:hypothetical protein KAI68_04850 [bacterium]|nr:hypothetical protein [bacterium]